MAIEGFPAHDSDRASDGFPRPYVPDSKPVDGPFDPQFEQWQDDAVHNGTGANTGLGNGRQPTYEELRALQDEGIL